jgi:hypothetical protein
VPAEIVGEVFFGLFRVIGRIFSEIILEILIRGVGYLICKPFSSNIDSDGILVAVVGLIFWGGMIFLGISLYEFHVIDSCLDSGGNFNYELSQCEH